MGTRIRHTFWAVAAGVMAITSVIFADPALAVTQTFRNHATARYLSSYSNGLVETIPTANGYSTWDVTSVATSYRLLRSLATGRCLDSNANRYVYTNPCNSGNVYQQWRPLARTDGHISLQNRGTGLCLDSNANGYVYTNACGSTNTYQHWY